MTATLGSRIARSPSVRDEILERAFSRRDAAAYETAYRRFGGRLYATALRILRSEPLAQDCVHDVLLHLWQRGSAYTPDRGALESFLTVCVRNGALMRLRKDVRQRELRSRLAPEEQYVNETDPIERGRIARAVARLTPLQAQMVNYAYYRAMTLSEIAAETNKPLGTVKSHISAALRALRKSLALDGELHA
jgi:RNA polymerase sigma-70 factor (ECF subfamily)